MRDVLVVSKVTPQPAGVVEPLPLWKALFFFGPLALLFRFALYTGIPRLTAEGLTPFAANIVGYTAPLAILFVLAFAFYQRDGYALTPAALAARFRLQRLTRRQWLGSLGVMAATFVAMLLLAPLTQWLVGAVPALATPHFLWPWLRPGFELTGASFAAFVGAPIAGNWSVVLLLTLMLFCNVFGEELWWRGYLLPRQEQAHGRWAWLVHGLLWWLWHLTFYPWQVFALLPMCLLLPYVAQRWQNNWAAILIHMQNALLLLLVLRFVLLG